jgi:hypothetical protein
VLSIQAPRQGRAGFTSGSVRAGGCDSPRLLDWMSAHTVFLAVMD